MTDFETLELQRADGVAKVWLNRPERHNAFNAQSIEELHRCISALSQDAAVRIIVLAGRGRSFCAGADLQWMQQQAGASADANLADARALAQLLHALACVPQPTLARVHGAALGGGLGLVAACDLALAAETATFGTPEVRLGLTPSTIAPYVIAAIGERCARRYFLSGERFDAQRALQLGLVHEVVAAEALDCGLDALLATLLDAGPQAQARCKQLIRALRGRDPLDPAVRELSAQSIAQVRAGEEAREGMRAFLERRKPAWSR